jgi:hypothetical protein
MTDLGQVHAQDGVDTPRSADQRISSSVQLLNRKGEGGGLNVNGHTKTISRSRIAVGFGTKGYARRCRRHGAHHDVRKSAEDNADLVDESEPQIAVHLGCGGGGRGGGHLLV